MMKEYMTTYNKKVNESREVIEKYKEVVWLAKKCATAIMENFSAYYFGEVEELCIEKIKLDFAQMAEEEYNMSLEEFNTLINAINFLDHEHIGYC